MGRILKIGPTMMASFFDDSFKNILRVSQELLSKQPEIYVVYMVGGFSTSPLLQEAVASGLKDGHSAVQVIAPRWPGLVIVLGAALFGAGTKPVISRKARLTYGTNVARRYIEDNAAHRQRKSAVYLTGSVLYLEAFKCYVERGDDLPIGTDREHIFTPLTDDQQKVAFDILVTKSPAADVRYLKDANSKKMVNTLTTVEVPMDMNVPFESRGVSMRLSFGGIELGIKCKRNSDGEEVTATTIFIEHIEDAHCGMTL